MLLRRGPGASDGSARPGAGLRLPDLRRNDLSGPVPDGIGGQQELRTLSLGQNPKLAGPAPASLLLLDKVRLFNVWETGVRIPDDEPFDAWLEGIERAYGDRCE